MAKAYLVFVLVAMTGVVIACRWLPIWAAAAAIPGAFLFFVWLGAALISHGVRSLYAASLEEQSLVLRGATATVHAVGACPKPEGLEDPEEPDDESEPHEETEPDRWVRVEMTVRPDPASVARSREQVEENGGRWLATGLTLLEPGVVLDPRRQGVLSLLAMTQGTAVAAERVDGAAMEGVDGEGALIEGAARLAVTFRVPAELPRRVMIRYFHVELAEIALPG